MSIGDGLRAQPNFAPDTGRDAHSWMDGAPCQQVDPEDFYPGKGGSTAAAKRICQGCDVRAICLEWALDNREPFGVWGGLSERERRRLLRARAA